MSSVLDLIVRDEATPAFLRIAAAASGRCRWLSRWDNAAMPCPDRPIPGGVLCAEHLIEDQRTERTRT